MKNVEYRATGHAVRVHRMFAAAVAAFAIAGGAGIAVAAPKPRAPQQEAMATPQGPLLVVVSIGTQRLSVYDKNGRVLESPVSSGQAGFETPQGVFAIIERNREHFSNIYNEAPMPNMQRITWSGVAMHAGRLPGYAASHGCIRLPMNVSDRLFSMSKLGTRVVVMDHEAAPAAFSHAKLFTVRAEEIQPAGIGPAAAKTDTMSLPMMLGAAIISPAEAAPLPAALPTMFDPFAARPAGTSRAAWASELTARAQKATAIARSAKIKAVAAQKEADRLMSQVLVIERTKSALAAKTDLLEARIAATAKPAVIARAEAEKTASLARLETLLADTDRLRAVEDAKRTEADQFATEAADAEDKRQAAATLAGDANRSLKPVSVFISRKTGKLYVRQGFKPLFEAPVTITDAHMPMGTHVFTAVDTKVGTHDMQWSALSTVGGEPDVEPVLKRNRRGQRVAEAPPVRRPHMTAATALDRIEIPDNVRQRIGEMLIPGSSLIVSDEGISNETGKGTDFVILTK
jgi:L,D-transpeptidase catalytic domain